MVLELRKRQTAVGDNRDVELMLKWFLYGLHSLLAYLIAVLPSAELSALDSKRLGDLVFDAYKLAAHRTRLVSRFRLVLDDANCWEIVESHCVLSVAPGGLALHAVARPDGRIDAARDAAAALQHPVWAHRRSYSLAIVALSWAYGYTMQYSDSSRARIVASMWALLLTVVAAFLLRSGPEHLPFSGRHGDDAESDDDMSELSKSEVSEPEPTSSAAPRPSAAETPMDCAAVALIGFNGGYGVNPNLGIQIRS